MEFPSIVHVESPETQLERTCSEYPPNTPESRGSRAKPTDYDYYWAPAWRSPCGPGGGIKLRFLCLVLHEPVLRMLLPVCIVLISARFLLVTGLAKRVSLSYLGSYCCAAQSRRWRQAVSRSSLPRPPLRPSPTRLLRTIEAYGGNNDPRLEELGHFAPSLSRKSS
jgi:hypothetical protein